MLKPLEEADSQSAVAARNLVVLARNFGLTESDLNKVQWQTGQTLDTLSKMKVSDEREERAFSNKLLSVYQNHAANEAKLTARLAELDTSEIARFNRCVKLAIRLTEITGKYHDIYFL